MKSLSLVTLVLLSFSLHSCGQRRIRGGGAAASETRTVSQFTAADITGAEEVEFLPAAESRVEISGYKNLLPLYRTTVKGGVLTLGFDNDGDDVNISNANIRVRVYSPGVERISLAGSGDVTVQRGAIRLLKAVSIAGSGDVTIRQADVPSLAVEIAGSGSIHAREARAARVTADIAGSGDVEVTATEELKVDIAGSGDVHYWGSPRVEKDIAGSGDVVASN